MAIRWLSQKLVFPSPELADRDGVVAVGGDCSIPRLLLAYRSGIFPWPMDDDLPLFWFSPDPRWVVVPREAHVPRSLRKQMRRDTYEVRADTNFAGVIAGCASVYRPTQQSTWITDEMRMSYEALHHEGYAHSIEAWRDGALVGAQSPVGRLDERRGDVDAVNDAPGGGAAREREGRAAAAAPEVGDARGRVESQRIEERRVDGAEHRLHADERGVPLGAAVGDPVRGREVLCHGSTPA